MQNQLKFRKYYHLTQNYKPSLSLKKGFGLWFQIGVQTFRKHIVRVAFAGSFLIVIGLLIYFLVPKLPVFKNTLVIGVVGEYTEDNLPQTLTQLYSSGLTKIEADGKVIPALATWETDDGKKFRFELKDNIFWQDGKEIKAADLEFNNLAAKMNVVDENKLEFILQDTFSPFPAMLTRPVFRKNSHVGTGPYRIAKLGKKDNIIQQIILEPTKDNLPEIKIKFYPNSQTASQSFKTGQVELLFNLTRLNGFENWKGVEVWQSFDPTKLVAIFYNTKDKLLENEDIRKALDYSINREVFKYPTTTSLPPNSWVGVESNIKFSLEKATEILKSAEIADERIQVSTLPTFKSIISEISTNWESLGFKVEILETDKVPENFQVAIFGLEIPADPDQYLLWHSTQSNRLTRIENPKLDKLLEDGRKTLDFTKRAKIYQEFQEELQKLVPASFLFFQEKYIVVNKNSEGELTLIKTLFPQFPFN